MDRSNTIGLQHAQRERAGCWGFGLGKGSASILGWGSLIWALSAEIQGFMERREREKKA